MDPMTDATLTLTATVPPPGEEPMVVECDGCYGCFKGKYYGGEIDAKTIKLHGGEPYNKCKGTGTRAVRYEVVAELEFSARDDVIEWSTDGCYCVADSLEELAKQAVEWTLKYPDAPLPGVSVTEKPCESSE